MRSWCRGIGSRSEHSGKGRASNICEESVRGHRRDPLSRQSGSYNEDIREKPIGSGPRIANPHTSTGSCGNLAPIRCRPQQQRYLPFMPLRRCICNSKVGVKTVRNNVREYYNCQKTLPVEPVRMWENLHARVVPLAPNRSSGRYQTCPSIALFSTRRSVLCHLFSCT